MRTSIMDTYNDLMRIKNPITGLAIYFEYISAYRRVCVLKDGTTWLLKVTYHGAARDSKEWTKSYGDREVAFGWAKVQVENRYIQISHILTIKEVFGKIIIDKSN